MFQLRTLTPFLLKLDALPKLIKQQLNGITYPKAPDKNKTVLYYLTSSVPTFKMDEVCRVGLFFKSICEVNVDLNKHIT